MGRCQMRLMGRLESEMLEHELPNWRRLGVGERLVLGGWEGGGRQAHDLAHTFPMVGSGVGWDGGGPLAGVPMPRIAT